MKPRYQIRCYRLGRPHGYDYLLAPAVSRREGRKWLELLRARWPEASWHLQLAYGAAVREPEEEVSR